MNAIVAPFFVLLSAVVFFVEHDAMVITSINQPMNQNFPWGNVKVSVPGVALVQVNTGNQPAASVSVLTQPMEVVDHPMPMSVQKHMENQLSTEPSIAYQALAAVNETGQVHAPSNAGKATAIAGIILNALLSQMNVPKAPQVQIQGTGASSQNCPPSAGAVNAQGDKVLNFANGVVNINGATVTCHQ